MITRFYALLAFVALAACGITGPVPPPGTPGIVNCSDTALHQAELNILPSVETALASANWEQALLTVAAGIADPLAIQEVSCVVAWVESEADKAASATADSLEATKEAHAKSWLTKYGQGITGAAAGLALMLTSAEKGLLFAAFCLGFLACCLGGCYAHTPTPSCAQDPNGAGCAAPLTDDIPPWAQSEKKRDGGP